MARLADRIYRYSPIFLQHMFVSAYGWHWKRLRMGGNFKKECDHLISREFYSAEQWDRYVGEHLRLLLTTAFQRVPHYRSAWTELGLTIQDIQHFTVADLPLLPVLEKAIARDDPWSLLVDGLTNRKHLVFHTSGSTGTPVATFWLPEELQRSIALRESRSCKFAGVSFKFPRATFSGRLVEPNPQSKGPYYRFNLFERQVYFSAFHLRPDSVGQYINALRRHHIQWITGYSNSIYQLAAMSLDQALESYALKAVITTSEKLTPEMRSVIEQAFSTKVYEEYGTVEDVLYVCECEYGNKHINPDAGIVEVVDEQFRPVPFGEEGEVLATGFIRLSQPMIRYRLGDRAILSDQHCACGRSMPILREVSGRVEDTVYGLDGRRMVRFHGIFVGQPHVREGQIIQERLDYIRVRIVPKPGFSAADQRDVTARIHQRLTDQVTVSVELVEHIERTKNGKFRAVICNIPEERRRQVELRKLVPKSP